MCPFAPKAINLVFLWADLLYRLGCYHTLSSPRGSSLDFPFSAITISEIISPRLDLFSSGNAHRLTHSHSHTCDAVDRSLGSNDNIDRSMWIIAVLSSALKVCIPASRRGLWTSVSNRLSNERISLFLGVSRSFPSYSP